MKTFLFAVLLVPFFAPGTSGWLTDFDRAKILSKETHQYILLNFSGSDWCSGCIKMHKEIFASAIFQQYADDHLILVNADFPRLRKNSLSKDLQKKNDALADKYNAEGIFPYTVLLDSNGTILERWNGYYDGGPEKFVKEIKEVDARGNN